mgnify:CR=1 FL=1
MEQNESQPLGVGSPRRRIESRVDGSIGADRHGSASVRPSTRRSDLRSRSGVRALPRRGGRGLLPHRPRPARRRDPRRGVHRARPRLLVSKRPLRRTRRGHRGDGRRVRRRAASPSLGPAASASRGTPCLADAVRRRVRAPAAADSQHPHRGRLLSPGPRCRRRTPRARNRLGTDRLCRGAGPRRRVAPTGRRRLGPKRAGSQTVRASRNDRRVAMAETVRHPRIRAPSDDEAAPSSRRTPSRRRPSEPRGRPGHRTELPIYLRNTAR